MICISSRQIFFFFFCSRTFRGRPRKTRASSFFAADVTLEAAALSLKIGFSKAELAAATAAAGAAVVDEAVDLLRI